MKLSEVAIRAGMAQLVEHFTRNEGVVGSSPISSLVIREKGSACLSDIPFLYPAEMPVIPSLTVLSTGHLFFLFFDHFLDHITSDRSVLS